MKKYINLFNIIKETKLKKNIYNNFSKIHRNNLKQFVKKLEELFNIESMQNITFNNIENSFYNQGIYEEIDNLQNEIINKDDITFQLMKKIEEFDPEYKMKLVKTKKNEYYIRIPYKLGILFKKRIETENKIIIDETLTLNINDLEFKELKTELRFTLKNIKLENIDNAIVKNKLFKKVFEHYKKDIEELYEMYKETFNFLKNVIVKIDYVLNNALNSIKYHYTKPTLVESDESFIEIKGMRHPLIERLIDNEYITHDITINNENQGLMIYGKNSCGKSSLIKAIGLNQIMCQCGLYSSSSNMKYSIFKSIFTRISGSDCLFTGKSSFTVELSELKNILKNSDRFSLIISDEMFRSTDYLSTLCIVAETVVTLINRNTKFLFASHLHDLPKLERIKEIKQLKFYHLNIEIINDEIMFYRNLIPGVCDSVYGVNISKYIINDDENFINGLFEFKKELLKNMGINTETKTSHYNSELYIEQCSVCDSKSNLETHHINEQHFFKNGIYDKKIHIKKDDLSNLVVLCKDCHQKLHNNKIEINKKIKTSNGVKII